MHRITPHLSRLRDIRRNRQWVARHQRSLLIGLICLMGVVGAQLVYGAQRRALPFVQLDGTVISGKGAQDIETLLSRTYDPLSVVIEVGDQEVRSSLAAAGILPDYDKVVARALDYPVWQQLVPFSALLGIGRNIQVSAVVDPLRFAEFAQKIVPLCYVAPTDATVVIEGGSLVLTPAVHGRVCTPASLKQQIEGAALSKRGLSQAAVVTRQSPSVSTADATRLMDQAQAMIDARLEVTLMNQRYVIDSQTLASWLVFTKGSADTPSLEVSTEAVSRYVTTIQKDIYITPGVTTVTTHDGKETARVPGVSGRGVAIGDAVEKLHQQVKEGSGVVALSPVALAPTVNYVRTYSQTQAGLQALLNDIVAEKGNYGVSVRQLSGDNWSAHAQGDKAYTTASTYKLFVAYAVLQRIEAGSMKWEDPATSGKTVATCFDVMIINSDNSCAEWFGEKIGWKAITATLHSAGLSRTTTLYSAAGFKSTANDEALFLSKLASGQLLPQPLTDRLLDVMKRQVYRAGIPAGAGVDVADKVGFMNGLLHDAAIVYGPRGIYILVIMTDGSSWGNIADATRRIHTHLQQ